MEKSFKGDYRVMRVVMSSSNPIETLHKIQTNQISLLTFLDMLEMLDVKMTVEEDQKLAQEKKQRLQQERDRRSK